MSTGDRAVDWLNDYLTKNGTTVSSDIKAAAQAEGFNDAAMTRARAKLSVVVTRDPKEYRTTYWSLPLDEDSTAIPRLPDPAPEPGKKTCPVCGQPLILDTRLIDGGFCPVHGHSSLSMVNL